MSLLVQIFHSQGAIVLRARQSELLILPQFVSHLATLKNPKEFCDYFLKKALVNRPARKLFEAWLRKDQTIWPKLFKTVHEDMQKEEQDSSQEKTQEKELIP